MITVLVVLVVLVVLAVLVVVVATNPAPDPSAKWVCLYGFTSKRRPRHSHSPLQNPLCCLYNKRQLHQAI